MSSINNPCVIAGIQLRCPAGSEFNFNGVSSTLDAEIVCPLNVVAQLDFVEASQQGKCMCESSLIDAKGLSSDIDCECLACPQDTPFGFAYSCASPIMANCLSFNCFGTCNGDINEGLPTSSPTPAPTPSPTDAASGNTTSSPPTMALLTSMPTDAGTSSPPTAASTPTETSPPTAAPTDVSPGTSPPTAAPTDADSAGTSSTSAIATAALAILVAICTLPYYY